MMNSQQICLKTVDELRVNPATKLPLKFYVPAYQRGYRWQSLQVTQLLDDIREFRQKSNHKVGEFYCLQPLVIKVREDGAFEVVDGQQRLTTVLLILRYFNKRLVKEFQQEHFTLAYETRPNLDEFMAAPSEKANTNVDYFHLYESIQGIKDWFKQHESEVDDIKSTLLNKTKVIWFELSQEDNPVDAFTRLNVGKIPLTNDELIRALFLRRAGPDDRDAANAQMRIAYEWDQLEKGLQADDFWYFLSNQSPPGQNRIGFIFDLVGRTDDMPAEMASDDYGLFYTFNQRLKAGGVTPESEWLKINQTYYMVEEWFHDRNLYHMVGFLISQDMPIKSIRSLSLNCTKSVFEHRLRAEIFRCVIEKEMPDPLNEDAVRTHVEVHLDALTYGSKNERIAATLLLFNVATLLQNQRSNLRFQFDSFKKEQWDIEHIRSIADDKPERDYYRKAWLETCREYIKTQADASALCAEINDFLKLPQDETMSTRFDVLYEEILQYFGEATEAEVVHGIANLTLLDTHTNRSYKNAVFAVKRHQLLNLDQHGIFVPLCTRNVFLKCYSPQVGNAMFWSEEDQDGYREAISEVLTNFFCGKQEESK